MSCNCGISTFILVSYVELLKAVNQLPVDNKTFGFNVVTVSLDRADAELVMRALFGLGPLSNPTFITHGRGVRVATPYRAASLHTMSRSCSIGRGRMEIGWTDSPGAFNLSRSLLNAVVETSIRQK